MKCTKCGREIPDNVRFCKYCGNTTDSSHVAKQNADIGNQRPPVNNQRPPEKQPSSKGAGNKKVIIIIAVIAAVVIIAAAAIFAISLLNGKKQDEKLPIETEHIETKPETDETEEIKETEPGESESIESHSVQSETEEMTFSESETAQSESMESETAQNETKEPAPVINMLYVSDVYASSLLEEVDVVHSPERIMDGNISTAWVEGAGGQGIGESVVFMLDNVYTVEGMWVAAGYQKNDKVYTINSRPEKITVSFSDGTSEEFVLEDIHDFQDIRFSKPIETSSIKITIDAVYKGSQCEDTVFSEVEFY